MSEAAQPEAGPSSWRLEVGRFRAEQRRRVFPMRLYVGEPAGARVDVEVPWPVPAAYDVGLRFDLADALVEAWLLGPAQGRREAFGWMSRPGVPDLHDQDLDWHAAARRAFAAREVGLRGFRAVTRTGWLDVVTGEVRVWRRLRL